MRKLSCLLTIYFDGCGISAISFFSALPSFNLTFHASTTTSSSSSAFFGLAPWGRRLVFWWCSRETGSVAVVRYVRQILWAALLWVLLTILCSGFFCRKSLIQIGTAWDRWSVSLDHIISWLSCYLNCGPPIGRSVAKLKNFLCFCYLFGEAWNKGPFTFNKPRYVDLDI